MRSKLSVLTAVILALSVISASGSYAAGKEGFCTKVKNFWVNLLSYPARVTEESASVVADTGKGTVNVVTGEVKIAARVTRGDTAKTKELITLPITETAETAVKAVEGIVKVPSEAAKDNSETAVTENK